MLDPDSTIRYPVKHRHPALSMLNSLDSTKYYEYDIITTLTFLVYNFTTFLV